MISIARLVVERAEQGLPPTLDEFAQIPAAQFSVWFSDLAPLCHARRFPSMTRDGERQRNRNRLRIEDMPTHPRCTLQSPDGRGLAWLLSGGTIHAYGNCTARTCPLAAGPVEGSRNA